MNPAVTQSDAKRIKDALVQGWTGERGLQRLIERLVSETRALEAERLADFIDNRFEHHIVANELSNSIRSGMA